MGGDLLLQQEGESDLFVWLRLFEAHDAYAKSMHTCVNHVCVCVHANKRPFVCTFMQGHLSFYPEIVVMDKTLIKDKPLVECTVCQLRMESYEVTCVHSSVQCVQ